MSRKQNTLVLYKEKALSFAQEFCTVAGAGIALTMGLDRASQVRPLPMSELNAFMSGASSGLLLYGGLAIMTPLFLNWSDAMAQNKEPSVEHYFPTHNHTPSRIAGIAAGAVMSLSVMMNTASLHNPTTQIDWSKIMDQGRFAANMTMKQAKHSLNDIIRDFRL